jgi:hypothetical protein
MSEEVKDEQSETVDEKSLEDQIAALEDIASALKEDVEEKADDETVEEKADDETVEEKADDEESAEVEAKSDDDDAEEKGLGEPDHSEEECKDMENCPWHGADAKEAEESDAEEKSAASDDDGEKVHAVVTGHPYDQIVLKPGDLEFDEDVEKGHEADPHEVPKKRRIIVMEVDPSQVTDDMKAYEVEVDDEEEEQPYPLVDEEEKRRVPMPPVMNDDEDESAPPPRAVAPPPPPPPPPGLNPTPTPDRLPPPPGATVPAANPRLARLLAMANQQRDEEEEGSPPHPRATLIGRKDDEEEVTIKDDSPLMDPVALSSRLKRLGYTSEQVKSFSNTDFVCAIERKVRGGDVCNFCRGGCASEKGLPSLLEVEVSAETEYKGEVVDSGYAPKDDIFVLDLKTDDGFVEAYYAGNGSPLGWIMLDGETSVKSADSENGVAVVSFNDAEQVALKNIKGKSLGVDVDIFLGEDAYVVEIDGVDGKSYDAYVSVDGKFLGSDEVDFTEEEADEIKGLRMEKESLESELRLKRAYASADTAQMAEDGVAMADGTYPILTSDDLFDAIRINYRAKSDGLRQHIEQRAEHLDRSDLLPPEWAEKAAEEAEFVSSLMELEMLEAELPTGEKREYTDDTRQEYAERGLAMEDGSYPIRDVGDLKNAIQAFGRSKNPDATKKHIKKRARALGATELLPDNWE